MRESAIMSALDPASMPQHSARAESTSAAVRWAGFSWERSSRCAGNGSCVEVARLPNGEVAIRDGKKAAASPVLLFTRTEWDAFTAGIRAGELL